MKKDDDGVCFMLCYVFDTPLGDTNKIILLGLHTMMKANINILKHMKDSLEDKCTPLAFWPHGMSCEEALKGLSCEDDIYKQDLQNQSTSQSQGLIHQHCGVRGSHRC